MVLEFYEFISSPFVWAGIIAMVAIKKSVYIVPQNTSFVIYTLGKYSKTLPAGIHFLIPFVQEIAAKCNLKEESIEISPQAAITKDNIGVTIDGILFIKVIDAASATNNISDYRESIIQLAMTTMRSTIGSKELDACFQNRDSINAVITESMKEATGPWGVVVMRYEIKDISPPKSIRDDMEKQMSAEREKRSVVLTAEGVKRARVLDAEAAKTEKVLAAEATKESQILEAEGEAEAITLVAEAEASALRIVGKEADTDAGSKAINLTLPMVQ
jgi:regulator of protease activity HflC (stomatin/prohibitin superfamily)